MLKRLKERCADDSEHQQLSQTMYLCLSSRFEQQQKAWLVALKTDEVITRYAKATLKPDNLFSSSKGDEMISNINSDLR